MSAEAVKFKRTPDVDRLWYDCSAPRPFPPRLLSRRLRQQATGVSLAPCRSSNRVPLGRRNVLLLNGGRMRPVRFNGLTGPVICLPRSSSGNDLSNVNNRADVTCYQAVC